jgi:hypothetical protein
MQKVEHLRAPDDCCERGVRATGVRRLCPACRELLAASLRDLPGLYAECAGALGHSPPDGLRDKVTGGPLPGLALNSAAADARSAIVNTLASWSARVVRERRVPAPSRQVPAMAAFLLAHLDLLVCHPAAVRFGAEVARVTRAANRAVRAEVVKRIPVGRCVSPGCSGALSVTVRPGRSGVGARVSCGTNPDHHWAGPQWTSLRRQMTGTAGGERWLSPAEIALLWHTPTGTVYRLASERRWQRVVRAGRTFYAEADVHATFIRRKAAAVIRSGG